MQATNPKDKIGSLKPNLGLIPRAPLVGVAICMEYGADKYGPYNWRNDAQKVGYMTYLSAAERHIWSFIDGESVAMDSLLCHLDHAISGLLVLKDAILGGFAIDDRPPKGTTAGNIEHFTRG